MTMKSIVQGLVVRAVEALVDLAETKVLGRKPGMLYTETDNPELIQAVARELHGHDARLVLAKLEDLEKAVYHIAGKQQDMILQQKELEKVVVSTATTLEEMVNGIDSAMSEDAGSSEEDFLVDAWGTKKKKVASSTSN